MEPLLSPRGRGFESAGTFNPAVVKANGKFIMLYRAQDSKGASSLGYQAKLSGFDHYLDDTLRFPLVRLRIRPYRLEGDINHVVGIQVLRQVLHNL